MHEFKAGTLLVLGIPQERFLVRDFLHIVYSDQSGPFLRARHRLCVRDVFGGDKSLQDAAHSQLFRQRAGVNSLNHRDALFLQVLGQRKICPPIADHRRQFANDKTGHMRPDSHVAGV